MRKMPSKVFPDIPFGADDSCRSRVACPTLNITKRDRSVQLAKSGFPTSQGKCISHTHIHSESRKKICTAEKYKNKTLRTRAQSREQTTGKSEGGREGEGERWMKERVRGG